MMARGVGLMLGLGVRAVQAPCLWPLWVGAWDCVRGVCAGSRPRPLLHLTEPFWFLVTLLLHFPLFFLSFGEVFDWKSSFW